MEIRNTFIQPAFSSTELRSSNTTSKKSVHRNYGSQEVINQPVRTNSIKKAKTSSLSAQTVYSRPTTTGKIEQSPTQIDGPLKSRLAIATYRDINQRDDAQERAILLSRIDTFA
ncbi:MAG: hypothetical protein OQK73_03285 [Gammaproteobacteria bacterium]|nr:hypothetical protein [Gammaproteobacteria bacterium]